jgi:hypothetical protein
LYKGIADKCTAKDISTGKVIGQHLALVVHRRPGLPNQDTLMPATCCTPTVGISEDSPTVGVSKDTPTQPEEPSIDPTTTSTTSVTSPANEAIQDPTTSSVKPTVPLAEETIETDATGRELSGLDKPAVAVLPDTNHGSTGRPSFVHSETVPPSPDTDQQEDMLETEAVNGEVTNQAGLESPSFVPHRISPPSDDIISTVEGSVKVGQRAWIPSTAIDTYLEMLSNHVNSIAGRVVVGVLSSAFWEWRGERFLLFGQREAGFATSGITTILLPRLANSNHWQLVLLDRKHQEVRVYCSMGFHLGSKDFLVSPVIVI